MKFGEEAEIFMNLIGFNVRCFPLNTLMSHRPLTQQFFMMLGCKLSHGLISPFPRSFSLPWQGEYMLMSPVPVLVNRTDVGIKEIVTLQKDKIESHTFSLFSCDSVLGNNCKTG